MLPWLAGSLAIVAAVGVSPHAGAFPSGEAAPVQDPLPFRFGEPHPADVNDVAWSPDGTLIATACDDCAVRIFEAASGAVRAVVKGALYPVRCVAFSPDGGILAAGSDDRTLRLIDPASGEMIRTISGLPGPLRDVTFRGDGARAAVATLDRVLVFETAEWTRVREILIPFYVNAVAFEGSGARIAVACQDRRVRIVEVDGTAEPELLEGTAGSVESVAFRPGEARLAAGFASGTIRLWNLAAEAGWDRARLLEGHGASVRALAFSPDGSILVSGSGDGSVRIWDGETGFPYYRFPESLPPIASIVFHPDGRRLACAAGREVHLLPVARANFERPVFDLDFDVEEIRVVGDDPAQPTSVFLRLVNHGIHASGPIAVSAEAVDPATGRVAPLARSVEIANLPEGGRTPTLFFDLVAGAAEAFQRPGEVELRVHADSLFVPNARRTRSVRLSTHPLELEIADLEIREDHATGGAAAIFEIRNRCIGKPGPLVVEASLLLAGKPLAVTESEVELAGVGAISQVRLAISPQARLKLRKVTIVEARVRARRTVWPRRFWEGGVVFSTRPLALALEGFVIETDEASGRPAAASIRLRNRSPFDPGPLEIEADIVRADAFPFAIPEALGRASRVTFPAEDRSVVSVSLPISPLGSASPEEVPEVLASLRVHRRLWPEHTWRETIRLSTQPLDLAVEAVRILAEPGRAPAEFGVLLALANRGTADPGVIDLEVDAGGVPAGRMRLETFPPAAGGGETKAFLFDIPSGPAEATATEPTLDLEVRAQRESWMGKPWKTTVTISTRAPLLDLEEFAIEPNARGVPGRIRLRLANRGEVDPGPLEVVAQVLRPGRRIRSTAEETPRRVPSLAGGAVSERLAFPFPFEAIMGGVPAEGIRCRIRAEREEWPGLAWEREIPVLRTPSVDVQGFEVLPDESGRPAEVRFRCANRSSVDPGPVDIRVEFRSGLRGDLLGTTAGREVPGLAGGFVTEPLVFAIPEAAVAAFDTEEIVEAKVRVANRDWLELRCEVGRLIPTRAPILALHEATIARSAQGQPVVATLTLRNDGAGDASPAGVSVEFLARDGGASLGPASPPRALPRLAPGEVSEPLAVDIPQAAAAGIAKGIPVDLRISLRGAVRPCSTILQLDPPRPEGGAWPWVLLLGALGGAGALALVLFARRRRAERGSTTEFFAMVEDDESPPSGDR